MLLTFTFVQPNEHTHKQTHSNIISKFISAVWFKHKNEMFYKMIWKSHLNLYLTPYRVLMTGMQSAMIEYIGNAMTNVSNKYNGNLLPFFETNVNEAGDKYIESLAGYTVITYLLGVEDKHLDNLLLTKNGKIFHTDVYFLFGYCPLANRYVLAVKTLKVRISKEMLEGMDGFMSIKYKQFEKYLGLCYEV